MNNLVASSLWHRLACLDPPSQLLVEIQGIMVNFFFSGTTCIGCNRVCCFYLKRKVAMGWYN